MNSIFKNALKGAAVLCGLTLIGCGKGGADYEPERPKGLPATAAYAGGVDGGEWTSCAPTQDNRLVCTIYDHKSGEARFEKSFRICVNMLLIAGRTQGDLRPRSFDAELGQFDGVSAFVDRPDKYYPHATDGPSEIKHYAELGRKYYESFGVKADCSPMSSDPNTWR